jgi:hypothetical protein
VLGNLHDHAARRARGARHDDGVGRGSAHHVDEAVVRRQTGPAQRAQEVRGANASSFVGVDGLDLALLDDGVLGPARVALDELALCDALDVGLDDFEDGAGAHHFALLDWWNVQALWVLALLDPAALGGVIGEVEGFDEGLVGGEGGEGCGFEREGGVGAFEDGVVLWGVGENPLAGLLAGHIGGSGGWW